MDIGGWAALLHSVIRKLSRSTRLFFSLSSPSLIFIDEASRNGEREEEGENVCMYIGKCFSWDLGICVDGSLFPAPLWELFFVWGLARVFFLGLFMAWS